MYSNNHFYLNAALTHFNKGFSVIPLIPGSKQTAVKWDPWLDNLSEDKIKLYWDKHPNAEIGAILPSYIVVLDADTPEALKAIESIESQTGIVSNCVTETKKGEHHFYRAHANISIKTQSYSTKDEPHKIDVKAERSLIILPPSTNKTPKKWNFSDPGDWPQITKEFVDLLNKHNGIKSIPINSQKEFSANKTKTDINQIEKLLKFIPSDLGYQDWLNILMAVFHETGGSKEGFELADNWSATGSSYISSDDVYSHWKSFNNGVENPITIGTLIKTAKEHGATTHEIEVILELHFEAIKDQTINQNTCSVEKKSEDDTCTNKKGLAKFSLRGKSAELESQLIDLKFVMQDIAIAGQSTVIYAAPNTGKTLITLHLLLKAIDENQIKPSKLFYLNMDDTARGLAKKANLFDEYDCHMLTDGHNGFSAAKFPNEIEQMISDNTAADVVIVLDTLKKFTDLMNKKESSKFTGLVRRFVIKGGTVIALAHTNKNKNSNNQRVHAGTTDIIDDFDCAYIVDDIKKSGSNKIVEFENIKQRGDVFSQAHYSYSTEEGLSYDELLSSVQFIKPDEINQLKAEQQLLDDTLIIEAIKDAIAQGTITKMKIKTAASKASGVSHKQVIQIIEKYTASENCINPIWQYSVGSKGAKKFSLITFDENLNS